MTLLFDLCVNIAQFTGCFVSYLDFLFSEAQGCSFKSYVLLKKLVLLVSKAPMSYCCHWYCLS